MSFAAALYGTAGSLRHSYKPGKMDSFGCLFGCQLVLDTPTLKPYGKITGQLAIDTGWPIRYQGLRVQLEAQCSLKFETKLDGRVSSHKKYENIMEGTGERDSNDSYQTSPIMIDIEPLKEPPEDYEIPVGNHRYRFSMNFSGEALPASFKTTYGSLKAGFLNVHKAAAPSYCIHPMYTVSHALQFTVKVDDYNMIKGEVLITIGSTREPVELLMISANSLNVDDRFPTRRRLSNSSTHSDCSGLSHFTLPPSYSQLTSRAPSCETLPPPYDSEENLLKVQQGKRRQSCLEFRVIPPEETSESSSPQQTNITPATTPVTED